VYSIRKVTLLKHQHEGLLKTREARPEKDQWFVSIREQEYGPLRLGHLAQLAKAGRLQRDDWVWKPGFDSWVAAGDVSSIFNVPVQFHNEPPQPTPNISEQNETRDRKHGLKERAKDQLRNFALMFLYLWIVFGLLAVHEALVLSQHQIAYQSHGLAIVNALIFAKVMLMAEDLNLGHRLNEKPLIYSILFKSFLFGITLICFHILEHVLIGVWNGMTVAASLSEIGADKFGVTVSGGIIATVTLVPFFILREISRVMGGDKFWSLFFHTRKSPVRI
jgi:hypothetical protein